MKFLDDVKVKNAEKASHQGEVAKISKEINAIVAELAKLTDEVNEGTTKGFFLLRYSLNVIVAFISNLWLSFNLTNLTFFN